MRDGNYKPAQPLTRDMASYGNSKPNLRRNISQCFAGLCDSYSSQKPNVGETIDPTDSEQFLQETAVPEKKKRGFFARKFGKK